MSSTSALRRGTLLIEVTHAERQMIKLTLDSELDQIVLESKRLKSHPIALKDVASITLGVQASVDDASPEQYGLDASVLPYWFTIAYACCGKSEERMNLLSFSPEIAQEWSTVVLSITGAQGANRRSDGGPFLEPQPEGISVIQGRLVVEDKTDVSTRAFAGDSPSDVTTSSPMVADANTRDSPLHYWTDWYFMLDLSLGQWTEEHIRRLASLISSLLHTEMEMESLERTEQELWDEYVRHNKEIPALPLVHDELLKAYAEPREVLEYHGDEDEKKLRLSALRKLESLRLEKAQTLDHFRIRGIAMGLDAGHGGEVGEGSVMTHYSNIGTQFWAILVGIDTYTVHGPPALSGCVADVRRMAEYLTTSLHVPESHILVLTSPIDRGIKGVVGGLPERENIINALYQHFRDNPYVQRGNNLLFHYSGHGTSYALEPANLYTEALCPMDREVQKLYARVDRDKELRVYSLSDRVLDISDRELNIIFADICSEKGPNLTVVLDCCFSGGATRFPSGERQLRAARHSHRIDGEDIVTKMFGIAASRRRPQGSPSPLSPNWKGDMASHVLLAACQSHETAKERGVPQGVAGAFTFALVSALSSPRGVDPALTYVDLVRKVIQPPPLQTIVLAGARRASRLWFQEGPIPAQEVTIRGAV